MQRANYELRNDAVNWRLDISRLLVNVNVQKTLQR